MSFLPKVAGALVSPIGALAGGAGAGAALGGVAGHMLFDKKKPAELPPQGQNDPRVMRSTDSPGYGRGSSSLSV